MGKLPGIEVEGSRYCGACGTRLRSGTRFCPSCGSPVSGPSLPELPELPEPDSPARRPLRIGLGLIALAVVAASVLVWRHTRDDSGGSAGPLSASAVQLDPEEAAEAVGCSSPCSVTSVAAFDHPSWGPANLISSGSEGGDYQLDVVDASGSVVWSHPFGTNWYELAVNEPAIDDTGHLFVNFNPGRYNGVIVLAPIEDGFEDFGTLPDYGDYNTRFYYAEAVDPNEDGTLEVEVSENDCIPSCADGSITSTVYTWDGEDYR